MPDLARLFYTHQPLITRLFCGKSPAIIRHPMLPRNPVRHIHTRTHTHTHYRDRDSCYLTPIQETNKRDADYRPVHETNERDQITMT